MFYFIQRDMRYFADKNKRKRYSKVYGIWGMIWIAMIIWGCTKTSIIPLQIDDTLIMSWNTNNISYHKVRDTDLLSTFSKTTIYQEKLSTTSWFTNSLIIASLPVTSWTQLLQVVNSNSKQLVYCNQNNYDLIKNLSINHHDVCYET